MLELVCIGLHQLAEPILNNQIFYKLFVKIFAALSVMVGVVTAWKLANNINPGFFIQRADIPTHNWYIAVLISCEILKGSFAHTGIKE